MTNLWKINNMDLWDVYGAYILKGSYNDLLSPPAPRRRLEYAYTDRNGVSVDSVSPLTFEPRRFTIKLAIRGSSASDFSCDLLSKNCIFDLINNARAKVIREAGGTTIVQVKKYNIKQKDAIKQAARELRNAGTVKAHKRIRKRK